MPDWFKYLRTWVSGWFLAVEETSVISKGAEPDQIPSFVAGAGGGLDQTKPTQSTERGVRGLSSLVAETAADLLGRLERLQGARGPEVDLSLAMLKDCDFHFVNELAEHTEGGSKYYLIGNDARDQAESSWPVDVGWIVEKDYGYLFCRITTVLPKDVRGQVRLVPAKCARIVYGAMPDTGGMWIEDDLVGLVGNTWQVITLNRVIKRTGRGATTSDRISNAKSRHELNETMNLGLSAALTARYSWHAAFGSEDGPRLLLPTNPKGCLSLFKGRKKLDGETRRSALTHWVSNHYRQTSADLAYVRDHLRFATNKFIWKDLNCELLVSEVDLEKNEFFREQAQQWRASRAHNRVRVRIKGAA